MELFYYGANDVPSQKILVFHRVDTTEGRRSLCNLASGYKESTITWLDERHVVAVLRPGGALRLSR